VMVQC